MNQKLLVSKIVDPYAEALYKYSVELKVMDKTTADLLVIQALIQEQKGFIEYLNNPSISKDIKKEFLTKTVKPNLHWLTFKCLTVLVDRDRTPILETLCQKYYDLILEGSKRKRVTVETAFSFTESQKSELKEKLKKLTKANSIQLSVKVDASLIGGFLVKTDSQLIDFTVKNKLQKLAKYLDATLEI
uniref:CF1 delta subunit of ATP synthase n=1 Tax=Climaconeis sp. TaxID=2846830 RepID=A0A8F8SPU3_9STRA|nr:CF1 delta subunit of ATP synthase [Climaconeis sp.]